jgi:hypothetical protein
MALLADHIAHALWDAVQLSELKFTPDANELWRSMYERTPAHPPEIASLLARQSLYIKIIAALLALINLKTEIETDQLNAAEAWMQFWEQTALFVFSDSERKALAERLAVIKNAIVEAITTLPGKSGIQGTDVPYSAIVDKVSNSYKKYTAQHMKQACEMLQRESPPRVHSKSVTTGGRSANLWSYGAPPEE